MLRVMAQRVAQPAQEDPDVVGPVHVLAAPHLGDQRANPGAPAPVLYLVGGGILISAPARRRVPGYCGFQA
jgi:hypothetical protein